MATEEIRTQLVVLGAGPGGYAAAFYAADLGMEVTLIDVEANPGGVCLYRGCIPSKALLHMARIIQEAKEAENFGVTFGQPKIDLEKLRAWKDDVVSKMTGGLGQLTKVRKIHFIQGRGSFRDSKSLKVVKANGDLVHVHYENIIVATGSRPATIPNLNLQSSRLLDSTSALSLPQIPKKLLVIGAGYIGLEMGSVYAALGSQVDVVEMLDGVIPGADKDLARVLHKQLEKKFNQFMFKTMVTGIEEEKEALRVTFNHEGDAKKEDLYDTVLVAIGRKPNSSGIGLENTKVEVDEQGFIKVALDRQTSVPGIFAIGDLTGNPMLAHKASHEARVAVEAAAGQKVAFEPKAIPAVIFTDPEVAWCGLSEIEAKAQGIKYEVAKFPWAASGRAQTLGRGEGFTKLIIDPESEMILGAGIVGPNVGDLISEAVVAIEMGATAADLKLCIHPHPTLSETLMEAAELFYGYCTDMYRPKKKSRV